MIDRISLVIGELIRWIIALLLIPLLIWVLYLFFLFPFEWLLSVTVKWRWFLHGFFWIFFGLIIVGATTKIGSYFSFISLHLVRQKSIYAGIVSTAILIFVIFLLVGTWSSYIDFSWEYLPYKTFNRILFSCLSLNILSICSGIYSLGLMLDSNSKTEDTNSKNESNFILCSEHSIVKNIDILLEIVNNSEKNPNKFKSYEDLIFQRYLYGKSIYIIKDFIYFCSDKNKILNNLKNDHFNVIDALDKIEDELIFFHIDCKRSEIPQVFKDNLDFGFERNSNVSKDKIILSFLVDIDWRTKEQWMFWVNQYQENALLREYCEGRVNKFS